MARYIAQIIMAGGQVVARAFARALREEMQAGTATKAAASESGKDATKTVKYNAYTGMGLEEAMQILNVKDISEPETYIKSFEHLFKVNDKKSGGSFYLQSKVYRAKERLDMELESTHHKSQEQQKNDQTQT